ncbi:MAG: hypothetical protein IH605_20535 [Burkholderiales bacterium]|nr:hypothetical protein [Burkholderiales bacterium]
MDKKILAAIVVLLSIAWSACTSDHIKRAAYEAAYQKGCIDRVGTANCEPEHRSYEQYAQDRDQLIKPDGR